MRLYYNNVGRLHTENKQSSRWHVTTGVQVGSGLNIYNYMVVYYSGNRSYEKFVKIFGQKNIYNRNNIP